MGWLLAALLGGALGFNSVVTPGKAAQKAEEALRQRFPGAKVEVHIEGKRGADVLKGRFKSVRIEMANFTLTDLPFDAAPGANVGASPSPSSWDETATQVSAPAPKLGHAGEIDLDLKNVTWRGIALEAAHFHLDEVDYDLGALKESQMRLAQVAAATASLDVRSQSLGPIVASRLIDMTDAELQIHDGRFFVTGKRRVLLGLGVPFKLSATPVPAGTSIELHDAHASVGGVPVPGLVVNALVNRVNPVYSFDTKVWPFDVTMRRADAQNDRLHIEADLRLKVSPPAPPLPAPSH